MPVKNKFSELKKHIKGFHPLLGSYFCKFKVDNNPANIKKFEAFRDQFTMALVVSGTKKPRYEVKNYFIENYPLFPHLQSAIQTLEGKEKIQQEKQLEKFKEFYEECGFKVKDEILKVPPPELSNSGPILLNRQ